MNPANQNILTFSVLLLIMMLGYQNCAPVSEAELQAQDVGISEPMPDFKVGFMAEDIPTNLAEDIYGVCGLDQDGSAIRWWAEDIDGEVIKAGTADCFDGEFSVFYEDLAGLSCAEDYVLHVQIGSRSHDEARLLVDCSL